MDKWDVVGVAMPLPEKQEFLAWCRGQRVMPSQLGRALLREFQRWGEVQQQAFYARHGLVKPERVGT